MSMHICTHPNCNIQILPSWKMCKKHHGEAMKQKRLAQRVAAQKKTKSKSKSGPGFFDAQGRVRPNMGLTRLKELDRQRWEAQSEAQAKETSA